MGWLDGGMEESGWIGSTKDTSRTTTLKTRYQQAVYGATDRAANAFNGQFNALDPNKYVAGPNSDLNAAWAGIRGLKAPGEYDQAGNLYNQAANFQAGNYNAPAAFGNFTAPEQFGVQNYAGPQAFGNYDLKTVNTPQNFSAADAKQYMDPFNEAVTEQARQQAIREGDRQTALARLQSSLGAGSGSSNAALQDALASRNMANTLADITAKGNSAAFQQGREQFNADVNRRLGAEQFNVGAGERAYGMNQATAGQNEAQRLAAYNALQRARESGYGLNTKAAQDAYLANQSTYGLNARTAQDAFNANQQGRQFAANLGLNAAQGLGALGTARQAANIQRYNALAAAGADRRNIENQKMAIKLQQALKGQDISRDDAMKLAQILAATQHGETRTGHETGTERKFEQTPSLMSSLGGLAGAAASMYLGAPMMLGSQGIGSIGGMFDKANNFWSGGGGGGDMLTDMSSYAGNNPRGSNGFGMNG
jgi:hypothetical protein